MAFLYINITNALKSGFAYLVGVELIRISISEDLIGTKRLHIEKVSKPSSTIKTLKFVTLLSNRRTADTSAKDKKDLLINIAQLEHLLEVLSQRPYT